MKVETKKDKDKDGGSEARSIDEVSIIRHTTNKATITLQQLAPNRNSDKKHRHDADEASNDHDDKDDDDRDDDDGMRTRMKMRMSIRMSMRIRIRMRMRMRMTKRTRRRRTTTTKEASIRQGVGFRWRLPTQTERIPRNRDPDLQQLPRQSRSQRAKLRTESQGRFKA